MIASCLVDTNVLLYFANPLAPQHRSAKSSIRCLLDEAEQLAVAPQVLYEFWSVGTRPVQANGLGCSVSEAQAHLKAFCAQFVVLEELPTVLDLWLDIVVRHQLKGKRIHDAHLLATMQANGVARILTFNPSDFPTIPGLSLIAPVPESS
jgi:predicted nucleic acid-binding protein